MTEFGFHSVETGCSSCVHVSKGSVAPLRFETAWCIQTVIAMISSSGLKVFPCEIPAFLKKVCSASKSVVGAVSDIDFLSSA